MNKIIKTILVALFLIAPSSMAYSQDSGAEAKAVRHVVDQIFDAMRAGDAETIKTLVLPETPLDRIKAGQPVDHGQLADWVNWVATLKPGQADEQIFDVVVQVEGPLATVWAPFTIAINGEIKSCGVNHFTLVKLEDGWKVAYLIDTHTPEKCMK